jgi:hypothetical protein
LLQHSRKDAKSHPAVEPFVGLRFPLLSGCLCDFEMDTQTPQGADLDARSRRAITIIMIVMGVFIVVPIALYLLAGKGANSGP